MRVLIASGLALALAAQAGAAPDKRVLNAANAAQSGELALLEKIVNIDSGTGDAAGAARVMAVLAPELTAAGARIETFPAEAPGLGDNMVATVEGKGRGRVLMIAHVDTVFPAGTVAKRQFRIEGDKAYGPGIVDEKGGVVEAVTAMKLLKQLGETNFRRITLLIETSEETGSPGTRKLIDRLVRDHDVELNMEPGDVPDVVTVWRKGSSNIHLTVHGRAAHAGVEPDKGRNAAVELIHQLKTVDQFPHVGEGLTVNLTTMKAGQRYNVIPDTAEADVNYRVRTKDQFAPVREAFETSARQTIVPDTSVELTVTPAFPPLASNPATDRLAARAKAHYAELGRALTTGGNGGASQSALAYEAGTPALDGLGPAGAGTHGVGEYMRLDTVVPRLYLLTKLLIEFGATPPAK